MNKIKLFILFYTFITIQIFTQNNEIISFNNKKYYDLNNFNMLKSYSFKKTASFEKNIDIKMKYYFSNYYQNNYNNNLKFETGMKFRYFYELEKYKFEKKEENLLRRSEILFFGSLTFTAFGSWFFLSVFNTLIYGEPFGKIRQEQFIPLFVGSSLISISIVLTDLFINIKPKLKNVEIY